MEKESVKDARVQELLEKKGFAALNDKERELVLAFMTELEYENRRIILVESKQLKVHVLPRPLVLPEKKNGLVIPLYQAVTGVAAAVVLTFFLVRMNQMEIVKPVVQTIAETDTVYQERLQVDTIFIVQNAQEGTKGEKTDPVAVSLVEMNPSPGDLNTIPLNRLNLENKGSSASNDESLSLIRNFQGAN